MDAESQIKSWVDELIDPEKADKEAKLFCNILQTVSDPKGNWEQKELADIAMRHAFSKTAKFEQAFVEFAGTIVLATETEFGEKGKVREVSETIN